MDENKLEEKLKAKQAQMEKNKEEIAGLKKKLSDVRKKKRLREKQEEEAKLLRVIRRLLPALEMVYGGSFLQRPEEEIQEIFARLLPDPSKFDTGEEASLEPESLPDTGTDPFQEMKEDREVNGHATGWE